MKINAPIEIDQMDLRKTVIETLIDEDWTINEITEDMVVEAVLSTVLGFCSYCDAHKLTRCLPVSDKHQIADAYATAVSAFIRETFENSSESEG